MEQETGTASDRAEVGTLVRELEETRAAVLRLASLNADLVTILAHDFKGPLTTVMGYAELLADGGVDEATLASAVGAMASASQKLARLANDTLSLSRLDASELVLERDVVDLAGVAEDAARSVAFERNVVVRRPDRAAVVHGDPQRLRSVVEMLIENAIAYSPAGGDVEVTIDVDETNAIVRVHDRGIGIPSDELPLLFERFARASNAKALGIGGLGLGLSLVRSLVEAHGGTVMLTSSPESGTIAIVTLPVAPGGTSMPLPMPRTLVIAKPTDPRSFVAYALRTRGYLVRVAADREAAELRMKRDAYDLAIVDARVVDPTAAAAMLVARDGSPLPRILIVDAHAPVPDGWNGVLRAPYLARDAIAVVERCFPPRRCG
jgi:two-component sensor histidine kinase/CheY-like chemotaxis protein